MRAPRSRFYDGLLYGRLMDPLLAGLHGFVAEQVDAGMTVLDVGCGTGDLAFRMASDAREVVGVELSPKMVAFANQRLTRQPQENLSFVLGDITTALADVADHHFDIATMVMMVHEMPADARGPVMREAARVAKKVLCVDFRVPMPWSITGVRNRFFEAIAGPEHFSAYRDFTRRGGIAAIADSAELGYAHIRYIDSATLEVAEIRGSANVSERLSSLASMSSVGDQVS